MSDAAKRPSWKKRFLILSGCVLAFILLFVVAIRITVSELFDGIASSRATGLSAVTWNARSMWSQSADFAMLQKGRDNEAWIARSADLQTRSSTFDRCAASLHQIVSAHHGFRRPSHRESLWVWPRPGGRTRRAIRRIRSHPG